MTPPADRSETIDLLGRVIDELRRQVRERKRNPGVPLDPTKGDLDPVVRGLAGKLLQTLDEMVGSGDDPPEVTTRPAGRKRGPMATQSGGLSEDDIAGSSLSIDQGDLSSVKRPVKMPRKSPGKVEFSTDELFGDAGPPKPGQTPARRRTRSSPGKPDVGISTEELFGNSSSGARSGGPAVVKRPSQGEKGPATPGATGARRPKRPAPRPKAAGAGVERDANGFPVEILPVVPGPGGLNMRSCPDCGTNNLETYASCIYCGKWLTGTCPRCKEGIGSGKYSYCTNCSEKLSNVCRKCSAQIDDSYAFCAECGNTQYKLADISQYV